MAAMSFATHISRRKDIFHRGPNIHYLYQLTNHLTCTFIEEFFKLSEARIVHGNHVIMLIISKNRQPGHSIHLQVGGDNPKIDGGILQNQYAKQSRILLSL